MKKVICLASLILFMALPATADVNLEKARKELSKENYSDAMDFVEKSLEKDPENIKAHFLMADIYCAREKYKTAIDVYDRLLAKDSNNTEALERLGHVYYSGEYYRDAIGIFNKVLRIQPENVNALYMLGMSHALVMDLDKGYTIFRRLKKKDKELAEKLLHQLQGHLT